MRLLLWLLVSSCNVIVRGFCPGPFRETWHAHSIGRCRLFQSSLDEDDYEDNSDFFAKQRRALFENVSPGLPDTPRPPSKGGIYNNQELEKLWDLHQQLSPQTRAKESNENAAWDDAFIPSIHDLVLQAVKTQDDDSTFSSETAVSSVQVPELSYPWYTPAIQERCQKITAIASDVDGTLIGSDQKVHPRTKAAVQKAVESAFSPMGKLRWFFPATGKTRSGAMNSLGPDLAALVKQCPGVFIQGLYCIYGDTVIYEKKLNAKAVAACEQLVAETGISVIAYDGDTLYTTDLTQTVKDLHEIYGEPLSLEIPSLADHEPGFHKILVCDDDTEKLVRDVRPKLEELAAVTNSRVTQAVPTMLELLPEGCSKALGVQKLCEVLGVNPSTDLLALGDAENDVEMLQLASIGVVMGNGSPPAREAGDIILEETSDEGGAGVAMEVLGGLV